MIDVKKHIKDVNSQGESVKVVIDRLHPSICFEALLDEAADFISMDSSDPEYDVILDAVATHMDNLLSRLHVFR